MDEVGKMVSSRILLHNLFQALPTSLRALFAQSHAKVDNGGAYGPV